MAAGAGPDGAATYLVYVDPAPPGVACQAHQLHSRCRPRRAKAAMVYNYKNVMSGVLGVSNVLTRIYRSPYPMQHFVGTQNPNQKASAHRVQPVPRNSHPHNPIPLPNLERLLIDIADDAQPFSTSVAVASIPRIFGSFGSGYSTLQLGATKIEGMRITSLDLPETWAKFELGGDVPNLPLDSYECIECVQSSLKTIVLRSYVGLPEETEWARMLGESAKALHLLAFVTEFVQTPPWLKRQRYALNFDGRASDKAQYHFMTEGNSRLCSLDDQIHSRDPFFLRYSEPYHVIKAQSPDHLLQAEFVVTSVIVHDQELMLRQLDSNVIFDEVSSIEACIEDSDVHLQLDVGSWVYRMSVGERFILTFAKTLNVDGTLDGGLFTRDSSITLAKFEHCMSLKVYNIVEEITDCCHTVMKLKGSPTILARFMPQQSFYLLMRK
ncbi:hypothetical protein EJB05_03445, partial [Eragrostis curvula]